MHCLLFSWPAHTARVSPSSCGVMWVSAVHNYQRTWTACHLYKFVLTCCCTLFTKSILGIVHYPTTSALIKLLLFREFAFDLCQALYFSPFKFPTHTWPTTNMVVTVYVYTYVCACPQTQLSRNICALAWCSCSPQLYVLHVCIHTHTHMLKVCSISTNVIAMESGYCWSVSGMLLPGRSCYTKRVWQDTMTQSFHCGSASGR